MRRSQTQHLSHLLRDFAKERNIEDKLNEVDVVNCCQKIMGKIMGRYVKKIYMENGELTVEVTSPMVKSELMMLREELRQRVNEQVGKNIVTKIFLK
jgi:precorrin-2 methylase